MPKKIIRYSLLAFFCIMSISLTVLLVIILSESFFFDKLLYKKSPVHGYGIYNDANGQILNPDQMDFITRRRTQDLTALLSQTNHQIAGVTDTKESNIYKIAIIGDSIVYGVGVRESQIFAKILEKKLNQIRSTQITIYALPGDSILSNYNKFSMLTSSRQFDLYIFGLVENDLVFDDLSAYKTNQQIIDNLTQQCPGKEFYQFSHNNSQLQEEEFLTAYYQSFLDQYANVCILSQIIHKIAQTDEKVVYFALSEIPNIIDQDSGYDKQYSFVMNRYADVIKEAGGFVLNFNFSKNPITNWKVSEKEGHPSAELHNSYANQLYDEITSNPNWDFANTSN